MPRRIGVGNHVLNITYAQLQKLAMQEVEIGYSGLNEQRRVKDFVTGPLTCVVGGLGVRFFHPAFTDAPDGIFVSNKQLDKLIDVEFIQVREPHVKWSKVGSR